MSKTINLNVSEIFYSLQGEGSRAGDPSIFIRLQGCKAKFACYQSGIRCDTEFESGSEMSLGSLHDWMKENAQDCKWIIWTGGEPLDQLTPEIVHHFKDLGYSQAVETSGLHPPVEGLDFISISPKVAEHVIQKNFGNIKVDELRYVRHKGQSIPEPSIEARRYYLSPHSRGFTIDGENLTHCIELAKENPQWSLSIQQHKIWNLL